MEHENRLDPGTARRRKIINTLILAVGVPLIILFGYVLARQGRYNIISLILAVVACLPFLFSFERRRTTTREVVVLAVLIAFAIVGRVLFMPIPFFKPVTAMVVIAAIYLGSEAGFLVGALGAALSGMFFGQGPWTPFQMFTWGIIGFIAGLPRIRHFLLRSRTQLDPQVKHTLPRHRRFALFFRNKLPLVLFALFAGVFYSMVMDAWSVLNYNDGFNIFRYLFLLYTSLPVMVVYMVSNTFFLLLFIDPIGKRLDRVKKVYGLGTQDAIFAPKDEKNSPKQVP